MVRTQIYLTKDEHDELHAVAKSTGKKRSELIREAIDRFLDDTLESRRKAGLRKAAGLWKDRHDLPDFAGARRSWNRE